MGDPTGISQPRPSTMHLDYYNLDDILATQEKVPSKFEIPFYRLGFLDPSSEEEHLKEGTKMDLPYWLARDLCTRRRKLVSVEMPKVYGDSYRQAFKADANVLNLQKMGPFFYQFGTKLLHFEQPDSGLLARSLLQVFLKRFGRMLDVSQNSLQEDFSAFTQRLDNVEHQLFKLGQQTLRNFDLWKTGQMGKIEAGSGHTSASRKRKREENQE